MNPLFYKLLSQLRGPHKQKCPKCSLEYEFKPEQKEIKCARCGVIITAPQPTR
jgi:DNA-directed RNA polymerase subunit RPC12/RpoP